jgi:hypothetical protein
MEGNSMTRIELVRAVASPFCVSNEDGVMVHAKLAEAISNNSTIELSFKGVTRLTTAFLNAAVGQLYDEFSDEKIERHLKIVEADRSHLAKLSSTISNAKLFFSGNNRELIREALKDNDA